MLSEYNDMKRQGINTENYEEYFLLYVDNELSDAEMAEVEEFARRNPGLNEELQVLLETKLNAEEFRMEGKESLYRSESEARINPENIEEWQLLFIDNELDASEAAAVEAYSAANAKDAGNLEWLKKTRLIPEAIPFPDKSILYRHAEKTGTVISMYWYRMAAAAAVLLVAGLLWMNRPGEDEIVPERPVVAQNGNDSAKDRDEKVQPTVTDKRNNEPAEEQVAVAEKGNGQDNGSRNVTGEMPTRKVKATNPVENAGNRTYAAILPEQEVKTVLPENTLNHPEIPTDVQVITEQTGNLPGTVAGNALAMNAKTNDDVKSNYASDALYRETGPVEENATAENGQPTRKGFRGIIRKANRFYNKVTNPDPDRPLVKVANFEIGLPHN